MRQEKVDHLPGLIIIVMANVDLALLFAGHLALPFLGYFINLLPILWPPDPKSQLMGMTLVLGKTEGRRRRG